MDLVRKATCERAGVDGMLQGPGLYLGLATKRSSLENGVQKSLGGGERHCQMGSLVVPTTCRCMSIQVKSSSGERRGAIVIFIHYRKPYLRFDIVIDEQVYVPSPCVGISSRAA
jgi:hypothetical protein